VIVALRHCADGQSCLGWKRFVGGQGRQVELIICYRSEFQSIASPRPCTTRQVCGCSGIHELLSGVCMGLEIVEEDPKSVTGLSRRSACGGPMDRALP
jgi:hypothetical protein